MTIGVYRIKNIDDGKQYIGSSIRLGRRLIEHKSRLRHNSHGNEYLQRAWNKHGENAFEFEILTELDTDIDTLRLIERMYLYNLEPEYNMSMFPVRNYMYGRTGNKHPNYGKAMFREPHSEESKRLMSINHPFRKLNEKQVANIKHLYKQKVFTQKELGIMHGVDASLISRIVNRKKWRHTMEKNN